jgi:hypothetical protein
VSLVQVVASLVVAISIFQAKLSVACDTFQVKSTQV